MSNMAARNLKVPKFILLIFYMLSTIDSFISFLHQILVFRKFSDSETYRQTDSHHHSVVASADLIRRSLKVVKFEDLVLTGRDNDGQDSCAICLCEYEGGDEIRPLMNCRHIFHGSCLDRWMNNNQRSCPLCRTSLVPFQIDDKGLKECNLNGSSLSDIESRIVPV